MQTILSSIKNIKYVLKYTNKGTDRAVFNLEGVNDEISDYHNSKYLGSNEAAATVLGLKTGGIEPNIVKLMLHMPDEQNVIYDPATTTSETITAQAQVRVHCSIISVFNLNIMPSIIIWVLNDKYTIVMLTHLTVAD